MFRIMVGLILLLAAIGLAVQATDTASVGSGVQEGRAYDVMWSCIPQLGCVQEVVTVVSIGKDGWVLAADGWRANLNHAMALRPHVDQPKPETQPEGTPLPKKSAPLSVQR